METCIKCNRPLVIDYAISSRPFCEHCSKVETKDELVVHPKHYNSHPSGVECITIVQHYNFNVGSAMKYLWRQGLKGSEPNVRDLGKAIEYIQFEIERIKNYERKS